MQHVKCVVVGDREVGKTCLSKMCSKNATPSLHFPRSEGFNDPNFSLYPVVVMIDGRLVKANLWDSLGREHYNSRLSYAYHKADVVLLLFSLINRASYKSVWAKWIYELRHHCRGLPIVLVGTKLDLRVVNVPSSSEQVHISTEEGEALAERIGAVCYLECSAVTRQNVNTVLDIAIRLPVIGSTEVSKQLLSFNLGILDQLPAKLRLISKIQDSMDNLLNHIKICSTESEYLVTRSQQQSSRIRDWFPERLADLYMGNLNKATAISDKWESVSFLLDRFICCMVAGEDILSFCAKADWQTTTLSLFIPVSCESTCSKFFLVTRDLNHAANILLDLLKTSTLRQLPGINEKVKTKWRFCNILEMFLQPKTQESQPDNDSMESEVRGDEILRHARDRELVLSKLESESRNPSSDLTTNRPLLLKRLQGEPLVEGASNIPDCFWLLEKPQYVIEGAIGRGGSKTVLKCTWFGQHVAIAEYEVTKEHFERETKALARVQHPNVVNFIGCAYVEKDQKGYLVTELMEQDLGRLISESRRGDGQMPFSLSVSMDIILQIVEAMIHMRKCRVSHRDLKPQNCLVSMKRSSVQDDLEDTYYVVKLIDFGSAKQHHPDTSICHTRKQGSTTYMAPEVHRMKDDCQYTWSADVYSFGMTCYAIMSGEFPFEGYERGTLVKKVCLGVRPPFSASFPIFWRQLIERCWHQNPKLRPSFLSIRKEIWECYDKLV